MSDPAPPRRVEETLRRRERALGWALFGLAALAVVGAIALALLAVPLIVIAFPLTLSALAVVVLIGRVKARHRANATHGHS